MCVLYIADTNATPEINGREKNSERGHTLRLCFLLTISLFILLTRAFFFSRLIVDIQGAICATRIIYWPKMANTQRSQVWQIARLQTLGYKRYYN